MSRAVIRRMARDALAGDARMGRVTALSAWAGNIRAEQLPVLGVVTPQERIEAEALDTLQAQTVLQVVVKRLGDTGIEDVLDADAAAIEVAICQAFLGAGWMCLPEGISTTLDGEGEQKIGTVLVTFRVTWHRVLPIRVG